MAKRQPLARSFSFLAILLAAVAAASAATIQDLLLDNGLPAGILPKTVRSFALDQATGRLHVRLDAPCYAQWCDNPVYFDRVVTGNLSYGELKGVVGLSQEELFLWLPVRGVAVDDPSSGVLLLDIGVARKQLSLSFFEDPPECRPAAESGLKWQYVRKEKGPQQQR